MNDLNIRIKIDSNTGALTVTQDGLDKVGQKATTAASGVKHYEQSMVSAEAVMGRAKTAFGGLIATLSAKEFIQTADTWNLLEGRLRLVTSSTQELIATKKELLALSNEDRVKFESSADLYARVARSVQVLNKTQQENLGVTDAISKTLIISGSSAESADAAIIQLGQGFASGVLHGEELNSVMEQTPRLAQAIADGMGVTIGELRQMGADGKLTADAVYTAILSQKDAIEKEFAQMPETVGQSLTVLGNQTGKAIDRIDELYGVTAKASEGIKMLSNAIGDADNAINTLLITAGTAATIFAAFKLNGWIIKGINGTEASLLAAARGGGILNASVVNATRSVISLQSATVALKSFLASNALTLTVGIVLVGSELIKSYLENPEFKYGISQQKIDAYKKGVEDLSSVENQARMVGEEYNKQSDILNRRLQQRAALVKAGIDTSHVDAAIAKTKATLKDIQKAAQDVYSVNETAINSASPQTDPKKLKEYQREQERLRKEAERNAQANEDANKALYASLFELSGDWYTAESIRIGEQYNDWEKAGLDKLKLQEWLNASMSALDKRRYDSQIKQEEDAAKAKEDANKALYASLLQLSGDWYTAESIRIGEQYNDWEKAGLDKLKLEEWINASMSALDKRRYDSQLEEAKKAYAAENAILVSILSDIEKAMDNQIFDAMVGKWSNFGSWFKDFWSSLGTSVARALSSQLSTSLISSIESVLTGGQKTGIQNYFSGYGIFDNSASMVNSSISASDIEAIRALDGTWSQAGSNNLITAGGTVIDTLSGKVVQQGTDIGSIISSASSLKNAYGLLTGGVGSIAGGIANTAGTMYGLGFTTAGDFLTGSASIFAGNGVLGTSTASMLGGLATAGTLGGIGGYALGSIGDALFGVQTKAGTYGAIGGSIGAAVGSIVPGIGTLIGGAIGSVLGSVVGGFFGSTKFKGFRFASDTFGDLGDIEQWLKKSSWLGSSNKYKKLTEDQKQLIGGLFDNYNYLLDQLGSTEEILIKAGRYKDLNEVFGTAFIDAWTGGLNTDTVYDVWKEYADSINQSVLEAMTTSVGDYISSSRDFQTWSLERSGNSIEALRLKSQWSAADLANYENLIGVSGVTVDNYLAMYKEAIQNNFDPTVIENWKTLGDQIMANAEAADAYTSALKDQVAAQTSVQVQDMMLSRIQDKTSYSQNTTEISNDLLKEIADHLKKVYVMNELAGAVG